jgi:RNA polymerase sigma-70 factor, ECF subfamily
VGLRSVEGWLYVVALNKLRTQRRRTWIATRLGLAPSASHELDDSLRRADIVAILQQLRPRERELIVAKYYIGMTQDEIAQHMGIRRGTVASALTRASARFREVESRHG